MDEIKHIGLEDFIRHANPEEVYNNQIITMKITGEDFMQKISPAIFPLRFDAFSAILVCKGEVHMTMDYITYTLQQNMILERSSMHLINGFQVSHDFIGYHIILSDKVIRLLFEEFVTVPKEYIANKRRNPVQKIDGEDFNMLLNIIERLRKNICHNNHFFQKAIIMNEVRNFVMELSNIGMQNVNSSSIDISYTEDLMFRFVKLLITKCKEWYEVANYSTELCVTPVYLSRAIKSISGKTAIECIHEARIYEAKVMLRNPDFAVQDVSDLLHFSDQSAFGKFFKKHTGISPMEYKKNIFMSK